MTQIYTTVRLAAKRAMLAASMLLCLLALLSISVQAAPAARRASHVIIISFDQGGGQEVQKATNMPTFLRVANEGAHTWHAYTIVPSITLPSHTSMVTGVGIQQHQIDWNDYRPDSGVVQVPTIFALVKKQGLTTLLYAGKEKFKHLNQPGSIDDFQIPGDALKVAAAFQSNFARSKPNLSFLHFADIDSKGHSYGLFSPQWIQSLADTDAALKTVVDTVEKAGVTKDTVIILTADHGGHNFTTEKGETKGTHGSSKPYDVEIPWVAWGRGVKKKFEIGATVVTYDTSATALWLLGVEIPETFWGRPSVSAFEK